MPTRYTFKKDYDHSVAFGIDVAYKAGTTVLIPLAHADGADAAGAGERDAPSETKPNEKTKREGIGADRR